MSTLARNVLAGLVTATSLIAVPATAQTALRDPQPPLFQMRMASETPHPGFDLREQLMGGKPAYVSRVNILSDDMIRHIGVARTADGLVLEVLFAEEGRTQLEIATGERVTSHMALLLDSEVASFAPIMATLRLGELTVGLTLPPDKAEHYLARFTEKWPPNRVRSPQ